jgi:hypothetical protein
MFDAKQLKLVFNIIFYADIAEGSNCIYRLALILLAQTSWHSGHYLMTDLDYFRF